METLRETQKKYCSKALSSAIVIGFISIFIDQSAIGKGLILGALFSILNFILMGEAIPLRIGKTKGKGFAISLGSIFFRYLLLSIPIVMAIKLDNFNLISTVIGIFSIQIILLLEHLYIYIASIIRKQT
ncbi:MAG: ATP synthase subunit I [Proteobacteria bacterium]|nr:ATP synthase subunit I [Pseudomonadota bacterium]